MEALEPDFLGAEQRRRGDPDLSSDLDDLLDADAQRFDAQPGNVDERPGRLRKLPVAILPLIDHIDDFLLRRCHREAAVGLQSGVGSGDVFVTQMRIDR